MTEKHRVQKLMSNFGYCSRRKAEEIIDQGRVKVNGETISLGDKATEKDRITVDDKPIKKERKIYLMFNKPAKCVDEKYRTVMDYVKIKERVFPVGRLDFNTSGLLLLTNDGTWANKITHPSNEIKKTYLVRIDKPISDKEVKGIEKGVVLDDGRTSPAKVRIHEPILIEVSIHEGKNRIVRRMLQELGFKVLGLERIKIGKLNLGDLRLGRYRKLSQKELQDVFN